MLEKPLVSVIMNCFNGEAYLAEAIESVLAQTYENWEIILWDNQSTDSSPQIVKNYSDKRITYLRSNQFTSLGEARNEAIKVSRGELIAFLDVDDIWLPKKLELQVPLFNKSKVGIAICDTVFFNKRGDFKQLYKTDKPVTGNVFKELLRAYYISLETVIIRRSSLEKLTYWFDNRFSMIEEMDLLIRLSAICELAYVDEPLAKWRMHEKSWPFEKRSKFPLERRQLIETYSQIFPNFRTECAQEIAALERTIALEESIVHFEKKEMFMGRRKIKPFLFSNGKFTAFYILSYLPHKRFMGILKRRGLVV